MALTFDASKIANHEIVTTHPAHADKWHPVTEALVFASMSCGFGSITPENVEKVHLRIALQQLVYGPTLRSASEDYRKIYVTREDVELHIGLRTNASPMTDAQFLRRVAQAVPENLPTNLNKLSASDVITLLYRRRESKQEAQG